MKTLLSILFTWMSIVAYAQSSNMSATTGDLLRSNGTLNQMNANTDSLGTDKEIPVGLKVWTVDERFGDRQTAVPDTLQHMYMNSVFTTGTRGEYTTTGNLGAPRINRIFIDRLVPQQFMFTQPYDS